MHKIVCSRSASLFLYHCLLCREAHTHVRADHRRPGAVHKALYPFLVHSIDPQSRSAIQEDTHIVRINAQSRLPAPLVLNEHVLRRKARTQLRANHQSPGAVHKAGCSPSWCTSAALTCSPTAPAALWCSAARLALLGWSAGKTWALLTGVPTQSKQSWSKCAPLDFVNLQCAATLALPKLSAGKIWA